MLAILALFMAGDSIWLRDLAEFVETTRELGERLQACFTRLSVPRKERERIQMLLNLWGRLRSVSPKQIKPGTYKRSSLLPDLISLVEITQFSRDDAQRLALLKSLLDSEPHGHQHLDHQHRRQRKPKTHPL